MIDKESTISLTVETKDIDEILRLNFIRLREERGLKPGEFADMLDISPSKVSQYSSGVTPIGKETMVRIVNKLNIDICELFRIADTPVASTNDEKEALRLLRKHPNSRRFMMVSIRGIASEDQE